MTTRLQGENFLVPNDAAAREAIVEVVPSTTLDQALAGEVDRVDAIKCDVEGAELAVLKGATTTLERFKPTILLEVEERYANRYGHRAAEVFALLKACGFDYQRVIDGTLRQPSGSLDVDLADGHNFLFTASAK